MSSLNGSAGLDLFIPVVSKKPMDIVEDTDHLTKRADTPDMFLKSTGKNYTALNRSVFNFSYADINQMMPEYKEDTEAPKDPSQILAQSEGEIHKQIVEKENKTKSKIAKPRIRRSKILDKACATLDKIFTDKELEDSDFNLPIYELDLVKCITMKKYLNDGAKTYHKRVMTSQTSDIIEVVNDFRKSYQTKKRKEEKIKFIFKHTLKNLKKLFFEKMNFSCSSEGDPLFFAHYFLDAAIARNMPIGAFYDPLNTSYTVNPNYKTLSKDYLILLFKNDKFKEDFFKFVHDNLLRKYQSKVHKKFKKLLKKLRKRVRNVESSKVADVVYEFIDRFKQNKRCKLPWTSNEIRDAIKCFDVHIKTIFASP